MELASLSDGESMWLCELRYRAGESRVTGRGGLGGCDEGGAL
jgi:hypothetical protein